MRSPKLAALELRRFSRGKLPRLGLVALTLIPLLYGALYLCSFWDPYSRLDKIPVALVNDDRGATTGGKEIHAGDDLSENLKDSKKFHWEDVSAADAAKGVENGTYYLSLTVPKDFSERIASSSGKTPQTGALKVRTNDANNYVVGSISKTVFSEVRAKTSATSSRAMLDKIFISFSDLHDKTAEAADGAGKLDDGLGTAKDKTGKLADGLGELNKGAGRISKGTAEAATKARQLSLGARKVSDGTQQLADKVHGIARKDLPYLREHGREIGQWAQVVADLSQKLDEDLGRLPGDSAKAAQQARENADNAAELYHQRCDSLVDTDPDCPKLKAIADGSALAADTAEKVNDTVAHTDFGQLRTKVRELHHGAAMVANEAPGIANRADKAIGQINQLNAGAHKVSQGSGLLADGIGTLADGAGKLHDGLGVAKDGADKITGGLFKLKDGSNQLSDGLHSGVSKIPDYNKKDRDTRTEVMADPVELAAKSMHKAPNYGTGLAPYFIPLSLWVGAMVAFMLLQPLGKRALAAGAPGWRIALGSWLPAYAIGVVQVLALMAVLHWGLGLEMARTAGTVGFLLLATACFTAIIQLLGAFFGPAGRVLTLVVLMLQLTSAGGTYPVQTSPGFFAAIHPFLPMSYVVDGLRRLITGGDLAIVQQGCAVLAVFTVGALALTALAARSRQVVRMKDLHPELSL
ncbi:YhgE/Pip domain-containing protein [Streptomyces platensis]|uniref:YhgE/Pip domain-containing protein n=1 Tax=Streptomyces platensis TaxID=58346 RepID=UPI001F1BD3D5|nr:YhgE/Pip domain-containing protein [Streptomyces platensis]MCF3148193.1 YhgE/Pip domain-containing protein [Streptomyces platensis]